MNEASLTSDVLEKADALIQRRRVFLAGGRRQAPPPASAEVADLPILTEVVEPNSPAVVPGEPPAVLLDAQRRAAIAEEVTHWLDERLPDIVLHTLDDLADRLVSRIDEEARRQLLPRLEALLDGREPPTEPSS